MTYNRKHFRRRRIEDVAVEPNPNSIFISSDPRSGAQEQSGTAGPYFLLRLLLLVIWIVGVNLWLVRHTGHGLSDPLAIGGIGGLLILLLGVAGKVIAAADKKLWDALPGKLVRAAVHGPTLAGLYLVAVFFMLNLSSIVVIQDQETNSSPVTVDAVDGAGKLPDWLCETEKSPVRSCVWTGPFGSTYRVSVQGYLPQSIEVYPLSGAKLRPDQTFRRLPTLLIRPPLNALNSLKNCDDSPRRCGQFMLCEVNGDHCRELLTLEEGHGGSFLIGWTKALPPRLAQDWQFELMAQGLAELPKPRAESIIGWKSFKHLAPGTALGDAVVPLLEPGMRLRAEVRTKRVDRPLAACKELVVQDVAFMDIAMIPTEAGGTCPP